MNRLIRGDFFRIVKKPTFYILPVIVFLLNLYDFTDDKVYDFDEMLASIDLGCKYGLPLVAGIPVFLGVYADELKAGALQTSIGRGLSRSRIALSKFIVCTMLTAMILVLDFIVQYLLLIHRLIIPSKIQLTMLITTYLASYLKTVGTIAFAAIFVYLSWNASIGIVVEILALVFVEPILNWIQTQLHIPTLDYSYPGQVDQACSAIAAGAGWIRPVLVVIVYIVIFNMISMIIFNRKELEL